MTTADVAYLPHVVQQLGGLVLRLVRSDDRDEDHHVRVADVAIPLRLRGIAQTTLRCGHAGLKGRIGGLFVVRYTEIVIARFRQEDADKGTGVLLSGQLEIFGGKQLIVGRVYAVDLAAEKGARCILRILPELAEHEDDIVSTMALQDIPLQPIEESSDLGIVGLPGDGCLQLVREHRCFLPPVGPIGATSCHSELRI